MFRRNKLIIPRLLFLLLFAYGTLAARAGQFALDLSAYGCWQRYELYSGGQDQVQYSGTPGTLWSGENYFATPPSYSDYSWDDYYVLNLSGVSQPITSVALTLSFTTQFSGTDTYGIGSTSTAPAILETSGTGPASVFNSLSDGTSFGVASPSVVVNGPYSATFNYTLSGDPTFINFLNSNLGNTVAIGGWLDTGQPTYGSQVQELQSSSTPVFTVTTVPEPGGGALLSIAAAACLFWFGRRMRVRGSRFIE